MNNQLQQRKDLCSDLMYAIKQEDDKFLESIIDDFVYHLSDKEVAEYEVLVGTVFGEVDPYES